MVLKGIRLTRINTTADRNKPTNEKKLEQINKQNMSDIELANTERDEALKSVATLKDGGYITSIVTNSTDGEFKKYKELNYATPYTVITKYSKNGDVVWQNAVVSRRGVTIITALVATQDGGFYAAGYGKNIGGQTGKGYYDGAVFKFNKKGEFSYIKNPSCSYDLYAKQEGIILLG